MKHSVAVLALLLSACGLIPDKVDPTIGWSAARLYREAKDELTSGNYEQAIKYYESLEARYPYGRFAQQAQLEVAYAYFKQSEQASAVAATERFIKLHPNHPSVDYERVVSGADCIYDTRGVTLEVSGKGAKIYRS